MALKRLDMGAVGAWTGAFALVVYLAVSGGGYDPIVRGEAGIAVWWIVLTGSVSGVFAIRLNRLSWVAFGLLACFVGWTALAMTWTESAERTSTEVARVATYLGVLALGLLAVGGRSPRSLMNGLACAFAVVGGLAVMSRLHPAWFPPNDHAEFLPEALNRLSYPLNSWNGLASFAAVGLPVLTGAALWARTRLGQALAAAALPVLGLCIYLTASRGGAISAVVAMVAVLVLFSDRLATLATVLTAAGASGILIVAASQRDALERGLVTPLAESQGGEMLVLTAIVCIGAGLLQVAIGLTARFASRPGWMTPPPSRTAALGAACAVLALGSFAAAGGFGTLMSSWSEFKATPGEAAAPGAPILEATERDIGDRLSTISGNGRWQYWQSAVDAMETDPLRGIGPGSFEFWWARNSTLPGFVRDAHSLWFETLGETGLVGLALLAGLFLVAVCGGAARTLRAAPPERLPLAAAAAGILVFAVAAAADWVWELAVAPGALMLLMAVAVGGRSGTKRAGVGARGAFALISLAAIVAISIPLAATAAVRRSQADAEAGRLAAALSQAGTAQRTQPYAASPPLQRALVLEVARDFTAGVAAARQATAEEPTNWRTWLIRARVEAAAGEPEAAVASFRRARALNPRSQVLPR